MASSGSGLPIVKGDYHLIVNDRETEYNSKGDLYRWDGVKMWSKTCLAKGQTPDFRLKNGDTPPGVYLIGECTITKGSEPASTWNAYGKYFFDLAYFSGAEEKYGRAGVGIHGGGTAAPDPLAPYQQLVPTCGCIRFYNADLEKVIYPLWQSVKGTGNKIYVSVNQY